MSRSVEEWIGKSDDSAVPPRVRLRIFERHDGRCHLTGKKIMPGDAWDLDHVVALINGGEHRELNLAPAIRAAHRTKTAADVKLKAKVARTKAKHLGIKPKRTITTWRNFRGEIVHAPRER
jgi:5-methylcytosine-specific restriction enzyme A